MRSRFLRFNLTRSFSNRTRLNTMSSATSTSTPRGVAFLRESGVPFEVREYTYIEKGGTGASSSALGVDEHHIIKTLVFRESESEETTPFIVLQHGDLSVDAKKLAKELVRTRGRASGVNGIGVDSNSAGTSKFRGLMATPELAEKFTGYQVGGTSPFGLKNNTIRIFMEASILKLLPKSDARGPLSIKVADDEDEEWDSQLGTNESLVDFTQLDTQTLKPASLDLITPAWILINGGARGTLVSLSVRNIVKLLRPILINVGKGTAAAIEEKTENQPEKAATSNDKPKKEKPAKSKPAADTASSSSTSSPPPSSVFRSPAPCLEDIRASTSFVLEQAGLSATPSVRIDMAATETELNAHPEHYSADKLPPSWAADYHYADGTDLTAQYVFVLDSVNFCFWPLEGYEYSDLAGSLKTVLQADPTAFNAANLAQVSEETVETWLQPPSFGSFWKSQHPLAIQKRAAAPDTPNPRVPIPLLTSRTRAIREVGLGLQRFYDGSAAKMIRSAGGDAARLVELITATFPAFRDTTVYRGRQIFLYKRAQILVGDLYGAFLGTGLGAFKNIGELTCFADYRVPQLLRGLGILKYSPELEAKIDAREEILPSELEIELRAATIQAVESMIRVLNKKSIPLLPFQLDWLLWERGEANLDTLAPHHRVTTIFY